MSFISLSSMLVHEVESTSKNVFAKKVRDAIEELSKECISLKKTCDLRYTCLKVQHYLLKLFPDQARIVSKWRSKTLDIKRHSTYKYSDSVCRGCNNGEEDVHHVMNCNIDPDDPDFLSVKDVRKLGDLTVESANSLRSQIERIASFLDKVTINLNRILHNPKCKNQGCV